MIYKILSIILFFLLLVLGGVYAYKDHQHKKETTALYNQVVELQGTVKEANNAISARGIEVENLRSALQDSLSKNQELAKNIKNRDEKIVSLNNVVLTLKNKTFDVKDATQSTVVQQDKDSSTIRTKVSFDQTKDYLKVSGYTLTNPAYAHIEVDWVKNLNLTLVLVKDENNHFKTYLDSQNSDVVPTDLKLTVDPSVFEKKWYEKINVMGQLAVGSGLLTGVGVGYDFTKNLGIFGNYINVIDGSKINSFYGISAVWHPFGEK